MTPSRQDWYRKDVHDARDGTEITKEDSHRGT